MVKKQKLDLHLMIDSTLLSEAKKNIPNISAFLAKHLEYELYHENPKFIEKQLDEENNKYEHITDLLRARLKVAKEKEQTKKQRLSATKPEVMTYRTIIPIKKKEDNP